MTIKARSSRENRRHQRLPVGVAIDFLVSGETPNRCRGVISDVSPCGMTFKSDAMLEKGMTLHLRLPSELQIRGEVCHVGDLISGQRRYGIQFHKITYPQSQIN